MNSTKATRIGTPARKSKARSVRSILAEAIDMFGDAGPLAGGIASGRRESITSGLSRADRDVVATSADLRRFLKHILVRVGNKAMQRVIARQKQLDLIGRPQAHTIHLWSVKLLSDDGRFDDRVGLANSSPWLIYMHPKGTSKTRTFVNTDLPPIVKQMKADLTDELIIFKRSPIFQKAAKARILAGLR